MENLFENLFTITNKNNNKIIKLEMEIKRLRLCLKMANTANTQNKETINLMRKKLDEQDTLIGRLNQVLKSQDSTLAKLHKTMRLQKKRLAELEQVELKMEVISFNQAQILEFSKDYKQVNG